MGLSTLKIKQMKRFHAGKILLRILKPDVSFKFLCSLRHCKCHTFYVKGNKCFMSHYILLYK